LTSERRPEATAAAVLPWTAAGRSAVQEKLAASVTWKGFSKMNVNSLSRYGAFAAMVVEGSRSATKVIRRVLFAIRSCSVGHVCIATVFCGGT